MIFPAVVVFSALTSVLAIEGRGTHAKHSPKLYARSALAHISSGVKAKVEFIGTLDNSPTFVKISATGLHPSMGGPFGYHIHTNPVPEDGNCDKTLAHLDPLGVTQGWICNPAFPQYCEEGDLSGKHGKLNGTSNGKIAAFGFSDDFIRFFPESHSILGRSIVIHAANKTRIACGNIISNLDGTANSSFEPTHKPSKYVKHYDTVAPVQPTPVIIPSNGTVWPDESVSSTFPRPLPIAALPISEALNVKLVNITHKVKFANSEQEVTQLKDEKVDGTGPFRGKWDSSW